MVDTTGWSVRNKANPYFAKANHVKLAKNQATKRFIDSVVDQFLVVRALLFSSNEPGFFYDFDDWSTLFQDTAGTQPVTAANQGVALALDKSGNGNHATQATTAARPLTVIHPDGGVRNLLDRTEEFDNAYWSKGSGTSVSANVDIAPNGTQTADQVTLGTSGLRLNSGNIAVSPNQEITVSWWAKLGTATEVEYSLRDQTNAVVFSGPTAYGSLLNTSDYTRVSFTATVPSGCTSIRLDIVTASGLTTSGTVFLWGAQLEEGPTATPYQKRVNFLDVTEAGKRSIRRLYFNGTSHFMTTPTITPNTDKAQVFAGVRRVGPKSQAGTILGSSRIISDSSTSLEVFSPVGVVGEDRDFGILQSGSTTLRQVGYLTTFSDPPFSVVMTTQHNLRGSNFTERMKLRLDAVDRVMTLSVNNSLDTDFLADTWNIGARGGTSSFFNGYLDQLIARFGTNLDSGAIETTEKYVSTKVPELVAASEVTWDASTDTYTQNLVGLGR
jgi:hypothetical protein